MSPELFTKQRPAAPQGFYAAEAAGLRWLAAAEPAGGVRVVQPVGAVDEAADRISVPWVEVRPATAAAAEEFGRRLAATHDAGADGFGRPPDGWAGPGFIGPVTLSYTASEEHVGWPAFFAEHRLRPYARRALEVGHLSPEGDAAVQRLCDRLSGGDGPTGPEEPPARVHGDLWSGNVLWDADGAVLIDPAAHGGHRESDLAMLALFGLPHLDRVLDAYAEAHPLTDGWRDRVELHQLFPVLVHALLYGPGYGRQAEQIARHYA